MRIAPFRLERFFAKHEFTARHLLCVSDCESMSVEELFALSPEASSFAERLDKLRLGYTESPGGLELREAISELYEGMLADDVLVHAGAEEAIFGFMNSVLKTGDHVIVHSPGYQSLSEVPTAMGCEVTRWVGDPARGFALDPTDLEPMIGDRTRAIVVNSPHNPTGHLLSRAAWDELVATCRKYGILLFSDEVYRFLEHDEKARVPAACDLYEDAISLGVMSKSFGLAGLRIGWVATRNRDVLARMAAFKDYTSLCSSAPSELLATAALKARDPLLKRNRAIVSRNLGIFDAFMSRHEESFDYQRPQAGCLAFPRWRGEGTLEAFIDRALQERSVLLAPGSLFANEKSPVERELCKDRFRLGFGRKDFATGLAELEKALGG